MHFACVSQAYREGGQLNMLNNFKELTH